MNYLLDTHTVLWVATNSEILTESAKSAVLNENSVKYVSIASVWETAIKLSIGKLDCIGGVAEFCKIIEENGFRLLPIARAHLEQVAILPFIHRDPFDRLLVATAISNGLTIITADENIHKYDLPWLW